MNTYLTTSLLILTSIIMIIFTLQNYSVVSVRFLNLNYELSLALVIILAFALGFLVSIFSIIPYFYRQRNLTKGEAKKLKQKDNDIFELKTENEKLRSEIDLIRSEQKTDNDSIIQ